MKILLATVLATVIAVPAMAAESTQDQAPGQPGPTVVQPQRPVVPPPSISTEGRGAPAGEEHDRGDKDAGGAGAGGGGGAGAGGGGGAGGAAGGGGKAGGG